MKSSRAFREIKNSLGHNLVAFKQLFLLLTSKFFDCPSAYFSFCVQPTTNTETKAKSSDLLSVYGIQFGHLSKTFSSTESMKPVKVNTSSNEKSLCITLLVNNTTKIFNRPMEEVLERTIARIITTIDQQRKKRSKKVAKMQGVTSVHDVVSPVVVLLDKDGKEMDTSLKGIDAWNNASVLKIDDEMHNVLLNPPSATIVSLSSVPIAGMTLYPVLRFTNCSADHSLFRWYRSTEKDVAENMDCDQVDNYSCLSSQLPHGTDLGNVNSNDLKDGDKRWREVKTGQTYTISADDVGFQFKIELTPGSELYPVTNQTEGIKTVSALSGIVKPSPSSFIYDFRQKFTQTYCAYKNSFRVVCYNLLADCYANTEFALNSLYPYCPKHALDLDYRLQLLQKEIEGYHGDIICLQEVDRIVYENYLSSQMSLHNYASGFANKLHTKEGEALFYNRSKFKLVSIENKILNQSLHEDDANAKVLKLSSLNSALKTRLMNLGTCVLLAVLQSLDEPSRYIVVANTHLYFHPRANNIRLIQIAIILNILQEKLSTLKESLDENSTVSCILCGDLNSNPRTGLIEFILSGSVPPYHADWYSGGKAEYHESDIFLSHNCKFTCANGFPRYSNYVAGFSECLDYIFVDPSHLNVDQVLESPSHELVTKYSALPSIIAPSDHIAQVVDLSWKPLNQE